MRKRISYTFSVISETEVPTTCNCTIFGRPDVAEPTLRDEFMDIFATYFPGKVRIVVSKVEEIPFTPAPQKTHKNR
jgi:hypothetical protein